MTSLGAGPGPLTSWIAAGTDPLVGLRRQNLPEVTIDLHDFHVIG
jgi:hypothetical protein